MKTLASSSLLMVLTLGTMALPAEVALLESPHGLAIDSAGRLLVSCRKNRSVVVMTRTRQQVRQFGADKLHNPGGLCVTPSGNVLVTDPGQNELLVFDREGRFLKSVGGLAAPEDVAAGANGTIYVADTGGSRIAVFDSQLKNHLFSIKQVEKQKLKIGRPVGIAVANGVLAIVDANPPRIIRLRLPHRLEDLGEGTAIPLDGTTPHAVAIGPGGRIYVATETEVRGYLPNGQLFESFRAKPLRVTISNLFQPGGLAIDAQGSLLAVDRHTRRVLATNAELLDPVPQVNLDRGRPTTAAIEWQTPSPQPTVLEYGKNDDYGLRYEDPVLTTRHRAVLRDLSPATCYHYRIEKPLEMIPEKAPPRDGFSLVHQKKHHRRLFLANVSANEVFASLPVPGQTDWASLPVIVLVYRNIRFPARDGQRPPNRLLDDNDLTVLKSELEKYRTWLWRHTACKLNLAFTYVVVAAERDHEELGSVTRPVLGDIQRGLMEQGKKLDAFWNVLVVGTHGWYALYLDGPVAGSAYELGSCYTGFGHGQKPGWYWFPVHEHGHLIHSMYMNSGFSTFAFPDAPWTMPGQFGEDFSFLAANYRRQPPRSWLALRSTTICQSKDSNGNEVPDEDPRVPLDEKRFRWNPSLGGDCLKRLMAGVRIPGHPAGVDTDFRGQAHRLNEGELYWINRNVPRSQPVLDGRIVGGEWQELYSVPNLTTPREARDFKAVLYAGWDDQNYYFAIKSNRPVLAGFDLDAANDGWFHGRDNLRFTVRPPGSGRKLEASGAIWDFLNNRINEHDGQLWYRDAYKPGDIRAATGEQDGWHVIECAVPARPGIRIAPGPGAPFALRAYLSEMSEKNALHTSFFDGEEFVYDLKCVPK